MDSFKTKPFGHQLKGLNLSRGREFFAYTCEQGTGKTWMAINDAASLWGNGSVTELLVIAPNGVHSNWVINELPTHMPDWVRWRAVDWRSGSNKEHRKKVDAIMMPKDPGELRILTVNVEALQHKQPLEFILSFCRSALKLMVVVDESHRFKNPSAARTKALMDKIRPHSRYRRIMSGTPTTNSPFDLFSQYSFLDTHILRTTSYYAFKAEYADFLPRDHKLVADVIRRTGKTPQIVAKNKDGSPRYRNLERLNQLIAPHSYRVLKSECLDLPEKIYTQSYFELDPQQAKAYEKMRKEARMICEGGEAIFNKLTSIGKLSQITSGFLIEPITERVVPVCKENNKLKLLFDRLEDSLEAGNSVIVFCRFIHEIKEISAECGAREWVPVEYYGEVSKEDRIEAIRQFQDREARIFIAQVSAASTGLTLHAASHVIYYSNTFSADDRWQSEDRAHRIGQTKSVVYEDLLALNTIDEKIVRALKNKKSIADVITGDAGSLFN